MNADRDRSEPREHRRDQGHPMHLGEPGTSRTGAARATQALSGTEGNRRDQFGYRCCKHCAEDDVHDLEPNTHGIACQTCDDPGAMLRERVSELEGALADERAKVARVERTLHAWQVGPWAPSTRDLIVHLRAALAGPEPEATEGSHPDAAPRDGSPSSNTSRDATDRLPMPTVVMQRSNVRGPSPLHGAQTPNAGHIPAQDGA